MTERRKWPAFHRSVFARLVVIMFVMAASLLIMVGGFYVGIVIPGRHDAIIAVMSEHLQAIADSQPDLETAQELATELDMEIRYTGSDGAWATDDNVPKRSELAHLTKGGRLHHFLYVWHTKETYVVAETDNGHYIFAREINVRFARAHGQLLIVLLLIMAGVVVVAYLVLSRALRPLRLLDVGVRQLSEGQLDVIVPKQSRDEFGVLTDAFNQMARRVKEMVRARDQLLIDVSHELRSPLTRMKVALEMVPEDTKKESLSSEIAEMETMVSELLELQRLNENTTIRMERVDLMALVHEMVERYRDRPPGVVVAIAPAEVYLQAEADRVRAVLRNLIENALKFSVADSRAVEIRVAEEGDDIVVRVIDDGSGIPSGDEEHVFEPFFRSDPSRSKKTGGYGLGLSICKRIMEAHGGTIRFQQHQGRGVTLVIKFPSIPE